MVYAILISTVFSPLVTLAPITQSHHLTLVHPFSQTSVYMHSFVRDTVALWNRVDEDTVLSPALNASCIIDFVVFLISFGFLFNRLAFFAIIFMYPLLCIFSRIYLGKKGQRTKGTPK